MGRFGAVRATCNAEYQACESTRGSIAASGAATTLTRSCSVIMPASSQAAVDAA
jgi:hypothetical protein